MSNHVEVIVRALAGLMDGQAVPSEEATFHLAAAIRALQSTYVARDYELLGLRALGLLLDRFSAGFKTQETLRNLGARE